MPAIADLQAELDSLFTAMQTLRAAGPEGSVTFPGGRVYTLRNLGELQRQYDWVERKLAAAQREAAAAVAAGGGAGVVEFGGPTS